MRKKILFIIMCLCPNIFMFGQSSLVPVDSILNSPNYLHGEGRGETDEEADKYALSNLISQISVHVTSDFNFKEMDIRVNGDANYQSTMESVIKTYSVGSLTNARCMYISHEPDAHVIRYILSSDVEKMFKEREEQVFDKVAQAKSAIEKLRIDVALKEYYWAYCLLKSMPRPNSIKYDDNGKERILMSWVKQQLDDIVSDLDVKATKDKGNRINLLFTYQGNQVTSLDFRYFNGLNFSNINHAKSGIAQIEFPASDQISQLQIKYEYEYLGQAQVEIQNVENTFKQTIIPNSTVVVKLESKQDSKKLQEQIQQTINESSLATNTLVINDTNEKEYAKTIESLLKIIKSKNYTNAKTYFTPEGFDMFNQLINYGQATIVGNPTISFYRMFDRVVCRSVPMRFAFNNNKRVFNEDVTFTFNPEGKIESLAFALDKVARDDIFCKDAWPDSVRMVLANFLENYQTAFALKRLDYISSIFSDDAIIITGCVVKTAPKTLENSKYINNEYVRYTKQNKTQYMANLEKCFKSNQFINLCLTDTEVKKLASEHGESYGMLIHQDYYSTNYSDTGYLFLFVDFNNPHQPTIQLRTWQPRRDSNINAQLGKNYKYYGLLNFHSF